MNRNQSTYERALISEGIVKSYRAEAAASEQQSDGP